jgi:hypothetical protein
VVFHSIEESDLTKGVIIIIVMVILAGYSSMLYLGKIPLDVIRPELESVDSSQFEGFMGIMTGISSSVTIMIGWVISTLLIHTISRISGGNGSLKRFFAMHGFASVPSLLNQIFRVIDASIIESTTLVSYFETYRDINNKLLKSFLGTNLINLWGLATIVLLVIATEENYSISRARAIITVLVPSILYFLMNYLVN